MNRWYWVIVFTISIFAVPAGYYPATRWWAIWGLIMVATGIWFHHSELARERRAETTTEENEACWQFYLTASATFLLGTGWALYNHLLWWSPLFGAGSLLLFFVVLMCDIVGKGSQENPA